MIIDDEPTTVVGFDGDNNPVIKPVSIAQIESFYQGMKVDGIAEKQIQSMIESLSESDSLLRSAVGSFVSYAESETAESERELKVAVNTLIGHADRLNSEALDSMTRFLTASHDSMMRELSLSESALDSTPARSVRSPDETEWVLSVPPEMAADFMVADVSGLLDNDGPTGENQSPMPSIAVEIGTAEDQRNNNIQNAIQSAVNVANSITSRGPIQSFGGGCNQADFEAAGIAPYTGAFGQSYQEWAKYAMLQFADFHRQQGGSATYSGPSFADVGNQGAGQFAGGTVTVTTHDTGEQITFSFSVVRDGNPTLGFPPQMAFLQSISGWPEGLTVGEMGTLPCAGGGPFLPDEPATIPPPPISPPASSPIGDMPNNCCPPDPVQTTGFKPTLPVPASSQNWNMEVDFCRALGGFTIVGPAPIESPVSGEDETETGISSIASSISGWAESILNGRPPKTGDDEKVIPKIFGFNDKPATGSVSESLIDSFAAGQAASKEFSSQISQDDDGLKLKLAELSATLAAAGWAQSISGAPTGYLAHQSLLKLRYLAPQFIPDQETLDSLYLQKIISQQNWECLTRANGNLTAIHEAARDAKQFKNSIDDVIDLYLRNEYSRDQLFEECRKRGVLNDDEIINRISLRQQVPTMPDLIRFMVRDVENAQVVAEGRLMDGFEESYGGFVQEWAKWQSIPESVFRFHWAAHWDLPSPTQTYEMIRRLRPGRVPESLVMDLEEAKRLMAAADIAPGYRDRLLAVSYLTPTRSEVRQGYEIGAYDRKELIELLQDTGLDAKGAETVAKLYDRRKAERNRSMVKKNTLWSVNKILSQFRDGIISPDDAESLLKMLGYDDQQIKESIQSTILMREAVTRSKCIKGIRRKYFVGAITENNAMNQIAKLTDDIVSAKEIVSQWNCERASSLQEVPARKNVEWAIRGIITLDELKSRLSNLRYSPEDIVRFEAEVIDKVREAQLKAAKAAAREQLAESRARLAELRRLIAEMEKKKKELEAANQPPKPKKP